jgi:hypothetical protein
MPPPLVAASELRVKLANNADAAIMIATIVCFIAEPLAERRRNSGADLQKQNAQAE